MINQLLDFENTKLDCSKTWKLISDGNTKGVFQLESRLGQSMAKKLKPSNIEELAALISIMRPGCLEALRDGKTVSNHFIDKKNGLESIDYFHPSLESILQTTYGEMVYQEQAMEICQKVANFDLMEADMLRKAIGKKNPEEMARIKKLFLEKSKQANILSDKEAEEIFGWIEKSQRYSFNKSHAISYALNAYVSAYAKTHHTKEFFVSYLKFAKEKIDPMKEVSDLVSNASESGIIIKLPDIRYLHKDFFLKDDHIYFGLTNIKSVGDSVFDKITNLVNHYQLDVNSASVYEILFMILDQINSQAAKAIISVGCLDYFKISRKKLLFYLDTIGNLSKREKELIVSGESVKKTNLVEIFSSLKGQISARRANAVDSLIKALENPAYSLQDSYEWIASIEKQYLGASITCSIVDSRNLEDANIDCKTLGKTKSVLKHIILGAEILYSNIVKTKKGANPGQEMAFIRLGDGSGSCDIVAFPGEYKKYKSLLIEGNTVMFSLEQSKNRDTVILKKCWQI